MFHVKQLWRAGIKIMGIVRLIYTNYEKKHIYVL
jgi:hypothetical protein